MFFLNKINYLHIFALNFANPVFFSTMHFNAFAKEAAQESKTQSPAYWKDYAKISGLTAMGLGLLYILTKTITQQSKIMGDLHNNSSSALVYGETAKNYIQESAEILRSLQQVMEESSFSESTLEKARTTLLEQQTKLFKLFNNNRASFSNVQLLEQWFHQWVSDVTILVVNAQTTTHQKDNTLEISVGGSGNAPPPNIPVSPSPAPAPPPPPLMPLIPPLGEEDLAQSPSFDFFGIF